MQTNRFLKHLLFLSALVALAAVLACNDAGCEGNQSSLPLAGFYSSQTKSAIALDSLTVIGVGVPGDSAIIRNARSVSQVYLPFNVDAAVSRFVFYYEQQDLVPLTDTVTIEYSSTPFFHSSDCGAMYVFDVLRYDVTHVLIDSIQIPNKRIDNTNVENVRIFFRTEEGGE